MIRRLYEWILALAAKPSAPWALGAVAFAESSFFPVPPDAMMVPMAVSRPDRVWLYATIATVASVLGGLLGYAIGALLFDSVGLWLFNLYGLADKAETFQASYATYGHWVILLKGLTPIPYKLVTITSGFAHYSLFWFMLLSVITRGARFFLLAWLLGRYGIGIRAVLDRHLNVVAGLFAAVVILGFVAFKVML
ncbi:MAG: YqaA family protein [Methylobacteriaceae bacterium]|jgi:membrane protein YqaA with SNARE-associated domain|uniref:DedA family protein n=5 Tax=Methylorubrum extorquens TaxID=408 RepID=B7KZC8_METC4|nr:MULTISPECIES: YqaA family protein [Methylobacteriaceae]KQO89218.1 cytochrome B [Methylobacterium sp. Leaf92]KQO92223.1 cytochrome B [Methylobacterium sp. Leaf90]KQP91397.1 cytochrome B [Methylobacterium sp. Leaf119]KQQ15766.1 cytochrome B [Methylobacterium sp. Leaf121]MBA9071012.1 membrane protein YqaA with SNARE-associated domain [Methylobacterium sp. RAS18]MDF9861955.1 membrane protein YqaA with SNARE-associated domain [Methylorubrum pseudosasae]MDH6635571.1 membrane protein YqaA with S